MLSEMERGTKSPTVRLAYQVSRALGCSVSALLEEDTPDLSRAEAAAGAVRSPPAALIEEPAGRVRREGHTNALLHGRLEVAIYTLGPASSSGPMEPNNAGTIELVLALDGPVELLLDGSPTLLEPGESASHGVHAAEYRNPASDEPCRFLVLVDTSRC